MKKNIISLKTREKIDGVQCRPSLGSFFLVPVIERSTDRKKNNAKKKDCILISSSSGSAIGPFK